MPMTRPEMLPLDLKRRGPADLLADLGGPALDDGAEARGLSHNELREVLAIADGHQLLLKAVLLGAAEIVGGAKRSPSGLRDCWWVVFPGLVDGDRRPVIHELKVTLARFGDLAVPEYPLLTAELRVSLTDAILLRLKRATEFMGSRP